MNPVIHTEAH